MMAPEIVAAERREDVRRFGRAWQSAGVLSLASRRAIDARYPDDRVRLPIGFRILAFLLTGVAVVGSFGFLVLIGDGGGERAVAGLAAVFAALCVLGTELQRGRFRRADAGAELATALLALLFAAIALLLWFGATAAPRSMALGLLALAGVAFVARWGSGVLGLLAALLVFAWLAQFPAGRFLWILVALGGSGPLLAGSRHPALSPTHRLGCRLAAGVAVFALYLAVNLLSFDRGWVEGLRIDGGPPPPAAAWRPVALVATAVMPLVLLAIGLRRRESLLVLAGGGCLAASLATFHHYYPLLPLGYSLLLAGLVMLATALGLRRWLRTGSGGERQGWTADALLTDDSRTAAVQAAINVVSFTPSARAADPAERTGGGRFGGGGATGNY